MAKRSTYSRVASRVNRAAKSVAKKAKKAAKKVMPAKKKAKKGKKAKKIHGLKLSARVRLSTMPVASSTLQARVAPPAYLR